MGVYVKDFCVGLFHVYFPISFMEITREGKGFKNFEKRVGGIEGRHAENVIFRSHAADDKSVVLVFARMTAHRVHYEVDAAVSDDIHNRFHIASPDFQSWQRRERTGHVRAGSEPVPGVA